MAKAFDPYKTLNIDKTADVKKIREAAKVHAKKNHSDVGGDRESFENGRRALAVLIDPKKCGNTTVAAPGMFTIRIG